MSFTKFDFIFILSLLLAIWFAITAWIWTYYVAIFVGYPAGIISTLLWSYGRKYDTKKQRYLAIPILIGVGLLLSIGLLIALLFKN